jgi:hypothetical protein
MSLLFWQPYELLILWYEHMTLAAPIFNESMKGQAYSSCNVRSSTFDETASPSSPGRRLYSCS